jgi:hypothetical protein
VSSLVRVPDVADALEAQAVNGEPASAAAEPITDALDANDSTSSSPAPPARTVADRWTSELVKGGHVAVARTFLRNYSKLNIRPNEAMFIIHLIDFKWTQAAPFPTYKRLAEYMGVSDKQVRRLAQSLQVKKLLHREVRQAKPNRFHLDKLFAALEELKASGKARK